VNTHDSLAPQLWRIAAAACGLMLALSAGAQQDTMPDMDMSSMSGMPMSKQPATTVEAQHLRFGHMIGTRPRPGGLADNSQGAAISSAQGMSMSSMQGGKAPPDARSPDYSDGYGYTSMAGMDMVDHAMLGMLMIDQLEYARDDRGDDAAFIDAEAWYGEDFNRLWLKAEGEAARGKLEDLRTEALWNHAIRADWGTQIGLRQDLGEGPRRTWAAFGLQGVAPLWFDTEVELYLGEDGRTAARVQLEYEELITQRLVLQPKLEVNLYGKDDPQRGIGSGLADSELGMRLRYDIEREFGPYIGVVWRERYGHTAALARMQGAHAGELQLAAGLRFWF
jgi:copper resistance protein B